MAQYNIDTQAFRNNNDTLFESVVIVDQLGNPLSLPNVTESASDLNHPGLLHATREIFKKYGDVVDFASKAKSVHKFGDNDSVGTTFETIWHTGGNETYVSTNIITHISSSNAANTQICEIEGFTVSGTGYDQQFTLVNQSVFLNGTNKVALPIPLARVQRFQNNNLANIIGSVYIYEDTTIVGGVPQTLSKIHLSTELNLNQSEKAAITVANDEYFVLMSTTLSVNKKAGAVGDFYLETRAPGKIFKPKYVIVASDTSGSIVTHFDPPIVIPKNYDVRIVVATNTTNVEVSGGFVGYLGEIIA